MHHKLTRKDIEDMQAEIDRRRLIERPRLLDEVKETRAQGDLSENFEYHVAKRAKNKNDSRIRFLERMIKTSDVIEDRSASDEAGIGKDVTIYIPEEDAEETYTIVSTMRQDSLRGLISIESPLGKALLRHKAGDTVTVKVNDSYSYEAIVREVKINEKAEDSDLREF